VRAEEELKKSREELRNLSTHLQSAREAERASVAREIHDELGGALTALKMDLATLEDALPLQGNDDIRRALAERVEAMAGLIDSTVKTMRRLITELRPVLLDSLGLVSAMEWLAEDFQNRTGVACSFHPPADDIDIDRDRSTAVYRIFQEALTNVARHAAATRVRATLDFGDGGLTLTVDDDGCGFDSGGIRTAKTFGILGMRERALIFGGEVTVRRRPGGGTTVLLVLPARDA
jgi:signal transduction histidine kinase